MESALGKQSGNFTGKGESQLQPVFQMLRKSTPGGSSTTTTTTSGTGLLSSSPSTASSRDLYHHSPNRHHHAQYIRSSRGESVAQQHQRATPPTSSSCTLEARSSNSTPKRGANSSANNTNQSHLSRTSSGSDISGGVGGNSIPSGGGGGGGVILRSPSHHHRQQQHQQQQHCCGCACSSSSPSSSNKGSRDNLLRNVVTRNNSPTRAHSPIHHHQVQHSHSCCCANQHQQQNQHLNLNHSTLVHRIRDCPVDSHPRLLTTTTSSNVNPNNQQLWLFGKDEGLDDEEDPNDSVGVGDERVVRRQDVVSAGPSHGCHHPSPLIVQSGASAQYNAGGGGGAIGTPTNTNAGGFGFFKFQNPSSSVASPHPELLLPMDFIQVLIHQHAKTIVALQDLQREVSTLKDFRTSLLHSLPATAAPTAPSGLSDAVWTTGSAIGVGVSSATTAAIATAPSSTTGAVVGVVPNGSSSSAPKIPHPDSGFSTETKSTNQKSDAESDDELYSLLSLIQCKVQESIIRNDYLLTSHQNRTATSSHRSSSNHRRQGEKPKERLGKLDKVLGNCDKVEFRKDFISRDVIRGVLGAEKTELQRQLFFALVKIENLKSVTKEQKTVDSRVYALSQENEQLRYKLKEMEIELEGTKATLRILQKNSYSPASPSAAAALVVSAAKLSTPISPSSTVLPEAPCHTSTPHHLHPSSRLVVPTTTWESDSLDNTDPADYAIPGATAVATIASSSANSTRQRLIQKLSDIESISTNNSSSTHHHHSSSPTTNISRLSNNYCTNSSSSNSSNNSSGGNSTSSKKSPAPKPPVIIEHSIMNTTSSTSPSPSSNPNSATSKQQKSASPVGNKSMSSIKSNNSSIPIAVSRLKAKGGPGSTGPASNNNNNNNNVAGTGKTTPVGKLKPGSGLPPATTGNGGIGTIWANWFS
ncbi:hypothetical protein Ocin01_02706 [Orchesella cincta]|uniref:Uncharacterized protein n=1 Tax=Orchesella cincta TaxID=48709 RepID=A0A1D2NFH5_ORCCI|nr:hypothetical protein Ocin01_02706 [Orchesella cincta]